MITGLLVFAVFTLTVATLGAYSIVAPWWTTKSGTAYFVLFLSLALLAGFFLVAEIAGEQPEWVKDVFLSLVCVAIAWNAGTIIWKQLTYWEHGAPTPEPHGPSRGIPDAD